MSIGDRIGVLDKGVLVQVGTPSEIYDKPVNTFVARAVGTPAMNLRPGRLAAGADFGGMVLPLFGSEPGALIFGVRPEDLEPGGEGVAARITDVEIHGVEKIVTLTAGTDRLRASVPVTVRVAVADDVGLGWNPARLQVFDAASGRNLRV